MKTQLPWQARWVARRIEKEIRERLPRWNGHARDSFRGSALSWTTRDDIVEVELHRRPCNEIGTTALVELEALADCLSSRALGARAVILHSSIDTGFCAGADLCELQAELARHIDGGGSKYVAATRVRSFLDRIHDVFDLLDTLPIPVIGALHGVCFGGGFELALCCDILVADKSTRFAFPELRLGLIPGFGGIPRLRRDLGNAIVRDLLLTGRSLGAKRAHEVGLVSQLVGRGRALEVARRVAAQTARFDAATVATAKRFTKKLPREELEEEKDLFLELLASEGVQEALTKFVESDDLRPYLP